MSETVIVLASRHKVVSSNHTECSGWLEQFRGTDIESAFFVMAEARRDFDKVIVVKEVELNVEVTNATE